MGVGVVGKGASLGGVSISGKEPACHSRRYGFNPWAGKILWRRAWQPTPVFFPGEPHGRGAWQATVYRVAKSQTQLKQLSMHE